MIQRYKHVIECVEQCHPKVIVDIGVWNGKRSVQIIRKAREINSGISYWGFDLWEDLSDKQWIDEFMNPKPKSVFEEAEGRIRDAIGTDKWILVKGDTKIVLPAMDLPLIDFAFIDGGHSLETIESDWGCLSKRLHKNSVVVFDDYWHGRYDAGCASLIDSLDDKYHKELMGLDRVGKLRISMVKVILRNKNV